LNRLWNLLTLYDKLLIISIIIISLFLIALPLVNNPAVENVNEKEQVIIIQSSNDKRIIPLSDTYTEEPLIIEVTGPIGTSIIEAHNGRVRMKKAPPGDPEKICEKTGWIDQAGPMIICVPNQISIWIETEESELYAETRFFMDTTVTIKVVESEEIAGKAINEAFNIMETWANQLDRFSPSSTIWKINENNGKGVEVSPELIDLLNTARRFAALSYGAFDHTIAPLMDLWGFGGNEQRVPRDVEIQSILPDINYQRLSLEIERKMVFLPVNMKIDAGGMAKGFIIDKGIETLLAQGIESAYINAGGNIRVIGNNKDSGRPWQIGIRKPREPGQIYQNYILAIKEGSVATSGDYERFFIADGVRYSHLLDPRTGYPAREMQSATIYAEDALQADILSTAVFVSGWEEGIKLMESLPGIEGLLVKEGEIWMSKGMNKYLR
jgi:FAD:protein FMN transferase